MNKTLAFVGIAAVAGIGLLALGRPSGGFQTLQPRQAQGGAAVQNASNADRAPDLTLQKLGGGTISLADYRGKKPVVLDFWASWCPNCRRDMPNLNRFWEKYKDQVEVIGVNLQESAGTVGTFIASRGISFPIALDPGGIASSAFGIRYTNTHFLINKEGDIVRAIPGDIRESDITSLISS